MFLKQIKLTNFRNYAKLDFKFKTPITILYGNNAQGKTNFLESVYFLATAKSPRADRDEEVIKSGEGVVRVEGTVQLSVILSETKDISSNSHPKLYSSAPPQNDSINLEIGMQSFDSAQDQRPRLTKRVKVNGIARRVTDYCQNLAVVYFAPEDINLVRGAPSLRRDHLDSIICQVDKEYKKALSKYEEVLTKKNKVLKAIRDNFASLDQLTFWLDQQISFGKILSQKRKEFFDYINKLEKKFGQFNYQYLENPISVERLKEYQTKEIDSASSLIGPHRDDFLFRLGERDLSKFGSRGEQRTAVMVLKLNEINFMEQILGTRPLLLLDDIFSELDDDHKKYVFEVASLQQSIITTVEIDQHLKEYFEKQAKVFRVEDGKII